MIPIRPITVLVTTRNEEANVERCLRSVHGFADQVFVIDSESTDRTVEIARHYAEVHTLAYEHGRIIPWIFQWGLDNLPIRNDWVLILEADQAVTPELRKEIAALLAGAEIRENGFYIRRRQIFRGKPLRFGGYGSKYLLKLFRRGHAGLDPVEQDTRVYVAARSAACARRSRSGTARRTRSCSISRSTSATPRPSPARRWRAAARPALEGDAAPLRHARRADALAEDRYYRMPLYVRPFLYFLYRYFFLLGILDGKDGFIFHFLQAFWFRLVVDVRLEELLKEEGP